MKKLVSLLIITLLAINCSFAQKKDKKEKKMSEQELKIAQGVATKMFEEDLVIYMTSLVSNYGRVALDGAKVSLKGDKFSCELPYQGDSRIMTYGSQNITVKATNAPVEIESTFNEKKDYYKLNFTFESEHDNELFNVTLKIFLSGKVTLELGSSRRESVTYSGGLYIEL